MQFADIFEPRRVGSTVESPTVGCKRWWAEVKFLETVPLLANQLPRADLPTLAAALVEKRSPEILDDGGG